MRYVSASSLSLFSSFSLVVFVRQFVVSLLLFFSFLHYSAQSERENGERKSERENWRVKF